MYIKNERIGLVIAFGKFIWDTLYIITLMCLGNRLIYVLLLAGSEKKHVIAKRRRGYAILLHSCYVPSALHTVCVCLLLSTVIMVIVSA